MQYDNAHDGTLHLFDCDGVIVDSNLKKVTTLKNALLHVGAPDNLVDWASREFQKNFGRTRSEHFAKFRDFKKYLLSDDDIRSALAFYSSKMQELYKDVNLIKETIDFIKLINHKHKYIVSASDQDELQAVLPKRIDYIVDTKNIFGGPTSKKKNIKKILSNNNAYKKVILYGDSIQDAKASIDCEIDFIGLTSFSADPFAFKNFCDNNGLKYFEVLSKEIYSNIV